MEKKLVEMLHLDLEPVGIFFGNTAVQGEPEKEGERFFCDADVAMKCRQSMPFSEKAYPRIVFAPLSRWNEVGTPDLVYIFANADQISALVTMQGFYNGKAVNTLAPFGAACHSIVYAAEQIEKGKPMAIMGLFDISQRSAALKDYDC